VYRNIETSTVITQVALHNALHPGIPNLRNKSEAVEGLTEGLLRATSGDNWNSQRRSSVLSSCNMALLIIAVTIGSPAGSTQKLAGRSLLPKDRILLGYPSYCGHPRPILLVCVLLTLGAALFNCLTVPDCTQMLLSQTVPRTTNPPITHP